jgi:hypothetical protein
MTFNPNRTVTLQSYTTEVFCEPVVTSAMFMASLRCKVANLDGKAATEENNRNMEM